MTNMTNGLEVVLKTDERGRVRMPVEKREKLLDEFEKSGLSGTRFAALTGVKYQTFASWARHRRKQRDSQKAPAGRVDRVQWLQAVVQQTNAACPLKLHLPGGVWMEIAQSEQVSIAAALVHELEKPC